MSLLSTIKTIVETEPISLPCEAGTFKKTPAPDQYVVLDPLSDSFSCADDEPDTEVQSARVSIYSKQSYTRVAKLIAKALIGAGLTITDRRYIGHEDEAGYHHYAIDVEENCIWEE